jgi:2-polyprenyl-6-methoxyphenol hydroxylase-like FAD-dependent oxidoreductase
VTETDVIIVGAGPTGLMLAAELRLAGVTPLILERQPHRRDTPKAGGLGGQILESLRYRGLLERFEAACSGPAPAPRFPFGGVYVDLTKLADSPMHALALPQAELEQVLDDRVTELGLDVRRGHEVTAVSQDDTSVSVDVRGPDGPYTVTARYLAGCDGARSRVREWAGIAFPGLTYPEVNRLAQVTLPDTVTRLPGGDLAFGGATIRTGFTRTGHGLFGAATSADSPVVSLYTIEDETVEYDDDVPMTVGELQDSVERVLGVRVPIDKPHRLSRFTFQARQAERYRHGRILLAGDAAHLFPATGVAINAGMTDAINLAWKLAADVHGWAPPGLLDTYHDERHHAGARTMLHTSAQAALRRGHDAAAEALRQVFQELLTDEPAVRRMGALIAGADIRYPLPGDGHHPLAGTFVPDLPLYTDDGETSVAALLHTARPVLLLLTDRGDLRTAAEDWRHRVDIRTAKTGERPADALLIRPDAYLAWAAAVDAPAGTAASGLRDALTTVFGRAQ